MSLNLKLLGTEIALSSANTVSTAKLVRAYNTNTTSTQVVTIKSSGGSTLANVSVGPMQSVFINKNPTDTVEGTAFVAVSVAFAH